MATPRDPLHVLHVLPTLDVGGMELALARLTAAMAPERFRHSIIAIKGEGAASDYFDASVDIHLMRAGSNEPSLPLRLRRLLKRLRPDVIHARNWGAWPDIAAARLLGAWGAPLIFSFHGRQTVDAWPSRRRLIGRLLTCSTRTLFTVSPAGAEAMHQALGVPTDRIAIIPNGVDTQRFQPASRPDGASCFQIGSVGNYTPVKNQALLIRAAGRLVKQGRDVRLTLAGEGPQRPALEALIDELNLAGHVELCGHLSNVPGFLQSLDAFVLPSRSENHPNALLEAMSCGLPCAATDVGGVRWVLDDGRCGRLIDSDDSVQLAGVLEEWIDSPESRRSLGHAARGRVEEAFSLDGMVEAYERLYRHAASPCRRVIMLGPAPPLTGGMAGVIEAMARSPLSREVELRIINSGKTTRPGRHWLTGVMSQLALIGRVAFTAGLSRRIYHVHTCSGFTFWRDAMLMLLARGLGGRGVWHIHGGRFLDFLESLSGLKRRMAKMGLGLADAGIILRTDWLEPFGAFQPKTDWRVIYNGVAIPPEPASLAAGPFLFLGHLGKAKGTLDIVAAAAKARDKGFDGRVQLAGPEQRSGERALLQERIAEAGLNEIVCLAGVLRGRAKQDALQKAVGLLLPSYVEAQPMAVLEGMAAGLPIIASRVGEIPRMVSDGEEGVLIEPGDVDRLAEAMNILSRDEALRRRFGAVARTRAKKAFSLDVMAAAVLAVYRRIWEGAS